MTNPWDEEFHASAGAARTLQWAHENGASTLGIELVGADTALTSLL